LIQGVTLPLIVKLFGLQSNSSDANQSERQTRLYLAREAVRTIDQYVRTHDVDLEHPAVRQSLNHYLEQEINFLLEESQESVDGEIWRTLQTECLKSQRKALIQLRHTHKIAEELFRSLERELDLQEEHLEHLYKAR